MKTMNLIGSRTGYFMANDISKVSSPLISPKNIESISKGTPSPGLSPGNLVSQSGAASQTSLSSVFPENIQSLLMQFLAPEIANKMLYNKSYFRQKTKTMKEKAKKAASKNSEFSSIGELFDEIDENTDLFEGYFLSNVQS